MNNFGCEGILGCPLVNELLDENNGKGAVIKLDETEENDDIRERRKMLSGVLPLVVGSVFKAEKMVSPLGIASRAMTQYDNMIQNRMLVPQRFVKEVFPAFVNSKLTAEGPTGFELFLNRKDLSEGLVEPYLRKRFALQGGFTHPYTMLDRKATTGSGDSFDAVLKLPVGSVLVKFLNDIPTPSLLQSLQNSALKLDSYSEVWVFVTSGMEKGQEEAYVLDSTFVTDQNFLAGRLIVLGLNGLLSEQIKNDKRFIVQACQPEGPEGSVKVIFAQPSVS